MPEFDNLEQKEIRQIISNMTRGQDEPRQAKPLSKSRTKTESAVRQRVRRLGEKKLADRGRRSAIRRAGIAVGGAAASQARGLIARVGVPAVGASLVIAPLIIAADIARRRIARTERSLETLRDVRGPSAIQRPAIHDIKDAFMKGNFFDRLNKVSTLAVHGKNEVAGRIAATASYIGNLMNGVATPGGSFDRGMLEATWTYWQHQLYEPPSVAKNNAIERKRFDDQINRGGNFYGGWGKVPETQGG